MAACADSCITSPSLPVRISLPLPSTIETSVVRIEPPTSVHARPVTNADLAVLVNFTIAELHYAEVLADVLRRER